MSRKPITLGVDSTNTVQDKDRYKKSGIELLKDKLVQGMFLDVRDSVGKWIESEIVNLDDDRVRIHFLRWDEKWDEWIDSKKERTRFAPFHKYSAGEESEDFKKAQWVYVFVPDLPNLAQDRNWVEGRIKKIERRQVLVQFRVKQFSKRYGNRPEIKTLQYWFHVDVPEEITTIDNHKTDLEATEDGKWFVGKYVEVLDTVKKWLPAEIKKVREEKVYVHYEGWSKKWDEWIYLEKDFDRIRDLGAAISPSAQISNPINYEEDSIAELFTEVYNNSNPADLRLKNDILKSFIYLEEDESTFYPYQKKLPQKVENIRELITLIGVISNNIISPKTDKDAETRRNIQRKKGKTELLSEKSNLESKEFRELSKIKKHQSTDFVKEGKGKDKAHRIPNQFLCEVYNATDNIKVKEDLLKLNYDKVNINLLHPDKHKKHKAVEEAMRKNDHLSINQKKIKENQITCALKKLNVAIRNEQFIKDTLEAIIKHCIELDVNGAPKRKHYLEIVSNLNKNVFREHKENISEARNLISKEKEGAASKHTNPWNVFQKKHKNKNLTKKEMLKLFNEEKNEGNEIKNAWNHFQNKNKDKNWNKKVMRKKYLEQKEREQKPKQNISKIGNLSKVEPKSPVLSQLKNDNMSESPIKNAWNRFQNKNKDKNWNKKEMRINYNESKKPESSSGGPPVKQDIFESYYSDLNTNHKATVSAKSNNWNTFQHAHAGEGLSSSKLSQMYKSAETTHTPRKYSPPSPIKTESFFSSSYSPPSSPTVTSYSPPASSGNLWNDFQHSYAGQGYNSTTLSEMYHASKN